jgi:filamentous hemagglutinin family protein
MLKNIFFSILTISFWLGATLHAEITLDGTLGSSVELSGPNYQIPADLGQQRGGNLFHSFHNFNLQPHEVATFSGPETINNIISRVTGGNPSHINGTFRSTIFNADFYFLNPYGIVFGPYAQLDVLGSFHASTAHTLRLQDGSEFNALQPTKRLLSIAPVAAFGFIDETIAPISVEGRGEVTQLDEESHLANLSVAEGKTLSLIGGKLEIKPGLFYKNTPVDTTDNEIDEINRLPIMKAPTGRINLASVDSMGQVLLKPDDLVLTASRGQITVQDSNLSASGKGGGAIYIRAGQLVLDNSVVTADTLGDLNGQGIDVQANDLIITRGGRLSSSTFGAGQGGKITIESENTVTLTGENHQSLVSGIFNSSGSEAHNDAGAAGNVSLEAQQLNIQAGATVTANSYGTGQAGHVTIRVADLVQIEGQDNRGSPSGIFLEVYGKTERAAKGGTLDLEAKQLHFRDGGQISVSTFGTGQGGDIHIKVAEDVTLADLVVSDNFYPSGIFTSSGDTQSEHAGDAGIIEIEANQLIVKEGAQIQAYSFGRGNGGKINLNIAANVNIAGNVVFPQGSIASGIYTGSMVGNAGDLTLSTGKLSLLDGGRISTFAQGSGTAGNILLKVTDQALIDKGRINASNRANGKAGSIHLQVANQLVITNVGQILVSSMDGDAGALTLEVKELDLAKGSRILAVTFGKGKGGNINLRANRVNLADKSMISASSRGEGNAGQIKLRVQEALQMQAGLIQTETTQADGGNIAIHSSGYLYLNSSNISTSVKAKEGNGGNITLTPTFIVLDDSQIIAQAVGGAGGHIDITAIGIYQFSSESLEKAINASSQLGIDGEVEIDSPDTNIGEALVFLPSTFIDASNQLINPCHLSGSEQHHQRNTFIVVQFAGSSPSPDDLAPSPLLFIPVKKSATHLSSHSGGNGLPSSCQPSL